MRLIDGKGRVMLRGVRCIVGYFFSVLRVFFIWIVALFLPRMFLWYKQQTEYTVTSVRNQEFKLGLENISDSFLRDVIGDGRHTAVALITNQMDRDQVGRRNVDMLLQKGVPIKKIFTAYCARSSKQTSKNTLDEWTDIPIEPSSGCAFSKRQLDGIDILMFDIQDSGIRHYGYSTMLLASMRAAVLYDKTIVILDRPNLLGRCMEGVILAESELVGSETIPIPVRHGMTIGELAHYFNRYVLESPAKLCVVPMENYSRRVEGRGKLLCKLSPNISSIDSCYGYSFLGLLGEVAPFDIGIGTDKAFQCILLPAAYSLSQEKWLQLKMVLKNCGIESKFYSYFSKRKQATCDGLQLFIKDIDSFSSFSTLLTVLKFFKSAEIPLKFSDHFDQVLGTTKVRLLIEGSFSRTELACRVNQDLQSFFAKAFDCFIYKPLPKIVRV